MDELTFVSARTRSGIADRIATVIVWAGVLLVTGVFVWLLSNLIWNGASKISWSFLTEAPRNAGRAGGIAPMIVSTLLILSVCIAVSLPVGVGSAVFLSEFSPPESLFGRLVRRSLDVLAGVPSIAFGLFGNAFFCVYLKMGFSILSGGLALACMVLPILIRSTEEGFRSVPRDYRTSAAALGMSRTSTLWHLLLPAAVPGLMVGLILGIGRAMAETAVLIFTSGYVDRMPESLMESGRSLSIHIFDLSMNVSGGDSSAYGTALVLVGLLLIVNFVAMWLSERWLHRRIILG